MKPEQADSYIDPQDEALLRAACGEDIDAPIADDLSTELLDASQILVDDLRDALAPEPLDAALRQRIHQEIQAANRPRILRFDLLRLTTAAAAAAVFAAVIWPATLDPATTPSATPVVSTDAGDSESDTFALAYTWLDWQSPVGASAEILSDRVSDVAERIQQTAATDTDSVLPWGSDDNWDVPDKQQDVSQAAGQRLAVHDPELFMTNARSIEFNGDNQS